MVHQHNDNLSLSAFDQYMRQVLSTPELTEEEEKKLLDCILHTCNAQKACDRLVEGYQPLIVGLARRFARTCQHMECLDFVQEGNRGLLHALQKFDEGRGEASFRTFAFAWIRGAMVMVFWQQEKALRLPLNKVKALRRMNVVCADLSCTLGREPTLQEVAGGLAMDERSVQELIVLQELEVVSLHVPSEDGGLLEEVIEDTTVSASRESENFYVEEILACLSERERTVLQLRYGVQDGQAHTQREVASLLGLSLSTVAQIDRCVRIRLRKALRTRDAVA